MTRLLAGFAWPWRSKTNPAVHDIDRSNYFDVKGKENNRALGITYTDADLLQLVSNIYAVLLTRGIRGTYVYVCDSALRAHLRPLLSGSGNTAGPASVPDGA